MEVPAALQVDLAGGQVERLPVHRPMVESVARRPITEVDRLTCRPEAAALEPPVALEVLAAAPAVLLAAVPGRR